MTPRSMAELAYHTLANKKARDIQVLRTTDVTVLADYFVIASGGTSRQIRALADELEEVFEERGEVKLRREGQNSGSWILLDYGALVVHLFLAEARTFYDLERLWGDAERVELGDTSQQVVE